MKPKLSQGTASYLRFLRQVDAVQSRPSPSTPALDAKEEELLNELALHWRSGQPLAVRAAMQLASLGSPSTLHRRIARLKAMGLIENKASPGNLLIKLLVPSKVALSYFDKLGAALGKSGGADVGAKEGG